LRDVSLTTATARAHIEFVDDANHVTRVDQQDIVEKLLVGLPK
jgi:hypothetical protein